MRFAVFLLAALFVAVLAPWSVGGENWPELRGPEANGHSDCTGLPLTWSETENVAWKTAIHDRGWSSPVVWGNQVWLTTATEDGHRLYAVGVDRETGRIVHDVKVFDVEKPEPVAAINNYASPTPAIEDGRVYVHYGTYGTACLDTASGAILWTRRDLNCDHHEGPGSSPILFENLLVFHVDGRDVQYIVALDKRTGQTAWKTDRSVDYGSFPINTRKDFCTPAVIEAGGKPQLVSPAAKAFFGYDPRTGEELWKVRHTGWSMSPRPIFGCGLAFIVNDYEHPELWALRVDGRGDVTDTHVAWILRRGVPRKPSLLLIDELLYLVCDDGVVTCLDAKSGEEVWKHRVEGDYSSSPFYADGRIYLVNHAGATTVLAPGREFRQLAENPLDGECMASPAVAGKAIFLRTHTHLYRLEVR